MESTSPRSLESCKKDREYFILRSNVDRAKYLAIHSNLSVREIGQMFDVPKSNVDRYRQTGRSNREFKPPGHPTLLPQNLEKKLVEMVNKRKDEGYAMRVNDFMREAAVLAESCQAHELNRQWFHNFLKRHPELETGFVSEVDPVRLEKCTTKVIRDFFIKYVAELSRMQDFPMLFWNADETRVYRTPDGSLCIMPKREYDLIIEKQDSVSFKTSGEMAINAMGTATQPLFTLPTLTIPNELMPSPAFPYDVAFIHSDSSWFKTEHFTAWFTEIFVPEAVKIRSDYALAAEEHTIVLFIDNASIHNEEVLKPWTDFYNIKFIEIPPKCTHVLQALDGQPFSVFKQQLRTFNPKMPNLNAPLLNKVALDRLRHYRAVLRAYSIAFIPHNIVSAFSRIGFVPLDPSKPLCSTLVNPRLEKEQVEDYIVDMIAKMDLTKTAFEIYHVQPGPRKNVVGHCVSTTYGVLEPAELPLPADNVSPPRKRANTK